MKESEAVSGEAASSYSQSTFGLATTLSNAAPAALCRPSVHDASAAKFLFADVTLDKAP
jgi:hypothetical protein